MPREVIYAAHVFDCEYKSEVSEYAERVNEIAPYVDYGNVSLNGSTGNFDLYVPIDRKEEFLKTFEKAKQNINSGISSVSIFKIKF